ncbi:porin [Roseomonas genomospecies 6]|uniref:Porin n=1 Tax=Roseomonas genomospecies 6 TaxID=214106 RepID=A0A9W7NNS9_9PROT|nr:porin [Roseomonas genomospecies 6]KAA0684050.1 porin [Roseomonas genomospecies 6]
MVRARRIPAIPLAALTLVLSSAAAAGSLPDYDRPDLDRTAAGGGAASIRFDKKAIDLGGWGALEVGQTESASRRMVATTPVRDQWFSDPVFMNDGAFGGPDARATYYSPRLHGFNIGLGYTPVRTELGAADPLARHVVEGVVRHDGRMGKARLRITAGAGRAATAKDRGTPRKSWVVGGQVALPGVTVGAGYREQIPDDGSARRTLNLGFTLDQGTPVRGWSVMGRLAHTQVGGEALQEVWSTGLRFRMTPKISLSADLGTMTYGGDPSDSTMLRVGTRVLF